MQKLLMLSAVALMSTQAMAYPLTTDTNPSKTDFTVSYRSDKVVDKEGVEVSLDHKLDRSVYVSPSVFVKDDKIVSYGGQVGLPLKLSNTNLGIRPYVGLERFKNESVNAYNVGVKAFAPVFSNKSGLTADIKYTKLSGGNKDKLENQDGMSYAIGYTFKFN